MRRGSARPRYVLAGAVCRTGPDSYCCWDVSALIQLRGRRKNRVFVVLTLSCVCVSVCLCVCVSVCLCVLVRVRVRVRVHVCVGRDGAGVGAADRRRAAQHPTPPSRRRDVHGRRRRRRGALNPMPTRIARQSGALHSHIPRAYAAMPCDVKTSAVLLCAAGFVHMLLCGGRC
eukprot:1859465-Rhodomonas_salina.3